MSSLVAAASSSGGSSNLLIFALPVLLIGFMFITQRRRQKETQRLQSSLAVGDEVTTTSGLLRQDHRARRRDRHLEVSPGVNVRFDRRAIAGPAPTASTCSCSIELGDRHTVGPDQPHRLGHPVAINPRNRGPLRTLAVLIVIVFGLYGLLAAVSTWGDAQRTPKLGLDLEGGTQLILQPKIVGNQTINEGQIQKAVDIIRQRVDGSGVAEAEVTTQGGSNIVVSLPGSPDKATIASLQKSSQLRFRAVLVEGSAAPTPVPTSTSTPTGTPTGKPTATATSKATARPSQARRRPPAKSGFPQALAAATTPAPTAEPHAATHRQPPGHAPAGKPQERERPGVDHPGCRGGLHRAGLRQPQGRRGHRRRPGQADGDLLG